jgi:multidrug efflux pump subunit AcrA (membrane-fusion protein)
MKIDVKNKDGSMTEWTFLGGSVGQIARLGLKEGPNALKPGDEITVTIVPAIDGKSPVGLLSAITYADGHTVRFRSPDE